MSQAYRISASSSVRKRNNYSSFHEGLGSLNNRLRPSTIQAPSEYSLHSRSKNYLQDYQGYSVYLKESSLTPSQGKNSIPRYLYPSQNRNKQVLNSNQTSVARHFTIKPENNERNIPKPVKQKNAPLPQKPRLGVVRLVEFQQEILEFSSIKSVGFCSRPGMVCGETKLNQDAVFFKNGLFGNYTVAALFDGHGMVGHRVSNFLALNLEGSETWSDILLDCSYSHLFKDPESVSMEDLRSSWTAHLEEIVRRLNQQLVQNKVIDTKTSGSTGILVVVHKKFLVCANVGDSEGFLFSKTIGDDDFVEEEISTVHSPNDNEEAQRILNHGGVIRRALNKNGEESGPLRVFQGNSKVPGLMMTRSFGDEIGHSIGVSCMPSSRWLVGVKFHEINGNELGVVVASDGLWDYMSPREVGNLLSSQENAQAIAHSLESIAVDEWQKVVINSSEIEVEYRRHFFHSH